MNVTLKQLPDQQVAYLRRIGPYGPEIGPLFERLCGWAGPRGLLADPEAGPLAIYWDNPEMTDPHKCRSDACVVVPEGTEVEGEIGLQRIPGGLCALYRSELKPDAFPQAWEELLAGWLPDSGYQPDDRPCYEIYRDTPDNHPDGKFVVDLCIAVKPL